LKQTSAPEELCPRMKARPMRIGWLSPKNLLSEEITQPNSSTIYLRTRVDSVQSLDGKVFIEFVALIYLSYIKNGCNTSISFSKILSRESWTNSISSNALPYRGKPCGSERLLRSKRTSMLPSA